MPLPSLLIDAFRLTLWLALLALAFAPLERLFALRRRESRRNWLADLGYFYMSGIVPTMLIAAPLAIVSAGVRAVTPDPYNRAIAALPLGVTIVLAILVAEIGSYWVHRWCHRSPYLWQFHAVHHTPDHLDWLVNTRAHPVDIVVTRLGGLVPIYLLGLDGHSSPERGMVPVIVTLIGTVWSFLVHANVRWRFGWLEHIIATPAFHHWHHTNDEHRDHNFSATLPVVDRVFGTLHLPKQWPEVYGIDKPVKPNFYDEVVQPFIPPR
ncbi:MAG: sterol desaturase family protein [Pseudomonadota bacterium]